MCAKIQFLISEMHSNAAYLERGEHTQRLLRLAEFLQERSHCVVALNLRLWLGGELALLFLLRPHRLSLKVANGGELLPLGLGVDAAAASLAAIDVFVVVVAAQIGLRRRIPRGRPREGRGGTGA